MSDVRLHGAYRHRCGTGNSIRPFESVDFNRVPDSRGSAVRFDELHEFRIDSRILNSPTDRGFLTGNRRGRISSLPGSVIGNPDSLDYRVYAVPVTHGVPVPFQKDDAYAVRKHRSGGFARERTAITVL